MRGRGSHGSQNRRKTASWSSGRLAERDLRTKMDRAVLENNARDSGRFVGKTGSNSVTPDGPLTDKNQARCGFER
jgi:hypothetical protein